METWIVRATYPMGFGELSRPDGDEPESRARMLSATSCADASSTFTASVEAADEDEAIQEAMALIGRRAAWLSITAEPSVTTEILDRELVDR